MTYMECLDAFLPFPSVLQGLSMARVSSSDLLLVSDDPVAEAGDLVAFIGLFKAACGKVDRLGVASPFPSLDWIRAVRAEGIEKVYLGPAGPGPNRGRVARDSLIELPRDICPALHVRLFNGKATSVCGNRFDQLVLGRRQYAEQCFACWSECRWAVQTASLAAAWSR